MEEPERRGTRWAPTVSGKPSSQDNFRGMQCSHSAPRVPALAWGWGSQGTVAPGNW